MKAIGIGVDGTVKAVEVETLGDMQAAVGGYFEMVPLNNPGHFTMYCNEEGKVRGMPFNPLATRVADMYRDWKDPLVGDVLILGPTDSDGVDTDVPGPVVAMVMGLVTAV